MKIGREKNSFTKKERARLEELEAQYEDIVNKLLRNPGNEKLYGKLREIKIKIVQITKEKIISY